MKKEKFNSKKNKLVNWEKEMKESYPHIFTNTKLPLLNVLFEARTEIQLNTLRALLDELICGGYIITLKTRFSKR